jgi:calcium uniporter protein, mitochondrial
LLKESERETLSSAMAAVLRRAVTQRCSSSPAYGLRRFMQEQPAFRPAVPPDRFMPLPDRIRDLGFGFPRINLDGLVPPAAPSNSAQEAATHAPVSLTVEEARKVLRATQMEEARAKLRASGAGAVSYAEYLRLCCDAAGADAGPSVARALDESGSVIVLGKTVFLRPDMVGHSLPPRPFRIPSSVQ